MTMTATEYTTYSVCVDCYFEHHGLLEEFDGDRDQLLSLIPEGAEVHAGLPAEEHADDCPVWLGDPDRADVPVINAGCECEHTTFSWSACDGCGSTLGGAREALTVFGGAA